MSHFVTIVTYNQALLQIHYKYLTFFLMRKNRGVRNPKWKSEFGPAE